MKRENKYIKGLFALTASALLFGCTGSFEEYNTNPFEPTPDQMQGDQAAAKANLGTMITALCQIQQNNSQYLDQFIGAEYGGMCTPPKKFDSGNAFNYTSLAPRDADCSQAFDIMMPQIYSGFFQIQKLTEGKGNFYEIARIVRIAATLHLSDIYGPIPYSKVNGGDYTVAYDSVEDLYTYLFADLDEIVTNLAGVAGTIESAIADGDPLFAGDFTKWIKYANTLKLRMAIRISNVAPALAQQKAEEAIANPVGVMTDASDSAWTYENDGMNPFYRAAIEWNPPVNDLRVSANLTSYLNGYEDPRLPIYVRPCTGAYADRGYVGLRHGMASIGDAYGDLSAPNIGEYDPQLIMSASEAWFLRAEAALNGWDAKGSAKDCYEKGIEVSMQERGAGIGSYLESTKQPANYTDPITSSYSANRRSGITPSYDAGASTEANRERILIQKWLANFPNGWETWADIRRTGYPQFFSLVSNQAPSGEGVSGTGAIMQRLHYPQSEYNTNTENVNAAVQLLGGSDTFGTRLWWAKKN